MVLRCHRRVWSRIDIQQQNARSEKPKPPFPNHLIDFEQSVTIPRRHCDTPWFQLLKNPLKSKRFFHMQSPEFFLVGFLKLIKWPPADYFANAKAPVYIHSPICISRFLLEKVGLKCHSGPKDSPRGLVRRRDKTPSHTYFNSSTLPS
ncbi:hypothetical protein TNCV_3675501 [Trichonephila clavipes]|nr:hypothetical protein TNCV_3675501 [Trichonephila clavipes]